MQTQVKPSLKAKYSPRVSCRQKSHKNPRDLDLWRWYSTGFDWMSIYRVAQNKIPPQTMHSPQPVARF